ncbi:MAG: TolC family protein [Gammaproteobacteria bacterium]|nr:TolC family protein [Gammaproteobacteria bacterium]MBU1409070.1 TolC family protein [Gammaproteobacteria bacterium]MBU1530966.1 TolC family protein [Gammaproteobacteria bacterium]
MRLTLLLVMLYSSVASAADPFMVMARTLPSPAAELRPASACDATAVAGTLTLARAVERALCANPATRSAWLTARLRAAELGQAQSAYLPEISLGASLGRNGDTVLPNDRSAWHFGLDAQILLLDFGGRAAQRDAAEALLAAARASHDASVRLLYLQTVTAYFNLLTAQGAVTAALEAEASALEALNAAAARVAAGTGIPVDRLQAKTVHTQRQIERIRAEGEAARLRGELAALMGDVSQTAWSLAEDETAFSQTLDLGRAVDGLIEAARTRRPEFRAAEATLLAREAGVRSAVADGKPRLSAVFDARRQDGGSLTATSSSVGVNLTIPLFTGYRNTYQIAAAQTQAELAAVERDRVAIQVALDVWRAYYRLQSETEADSRSADLVESAAAAERLALGRYRAGLGILLDVLTAQANLAQARQSQLQTRLGLRVARAELAQAMGELSWDWMEPAQQEGMQ